LDYDLGPILPPVGKRKCAGSCIIVLGENLFWTLVLRKNICWTILRISDIILQKSSSLSSMCDNEGAFLLIIKSHNSDSLEIDVHEF